MGPLRLVAVVGLSLLVHGVLFYGLMHLPPMPQVALRKPVEVEILAPKPPPPPVKEEEKPKPKVKPPPVRVAMVQKLPPPPKDAPPPPNEPPKPDAKPAPVVVGLTLSSTSTAGGFAAPVGNTLYGKTDNTAQAPAQVKQYAAKKYAPAYQLDTQPERLSEYQPPYPSSARAEGIEGVVLLKVSIDATGKVTDVKVVDGPGHGLNEAAQAALYKFKFSAAIKGGEAVATEITYRFTFELPPGL